MTTLYTALGHNIQQHRQGLLDYSLAHLSILAHFCFRNRKEGLFSFVPLLPYIHKVNISHTAPVFDLSLNYSMPFLSWGNHTCSESHWRPTLPSPTAWHTVTAVAAKANLI